MKMQRALTIIFQLTSILSVRASWLNDGVCRSTIPCDDFVDLQVIIDLCIYSGLYKISLDACSSGPVYKLPGQSHIVIAPSFGITLFCSEGLDCVLKAAPDADAEEFRGGMLYVANTPSITIENIKFDGTLPNSQKLTAQQAGGLVNVEYTDEVTILDSAFINGRSGTRGGGLSIDNARTISISSTIFIGNEAYVKGGGLFIASPGPDVVTGPEAHVYINNTSFTDCRANGRNADKTVGGGAFISVPGGTVETSDELFFESCRADKGGGIFIDALDTNSKRLRCNNCDVADGSCGGCLAVRNGRTFNLESFHATIPVDEADDYTVCVKNSGGDLLDPVYVDWKTMQGATPFAASGNTYSRMKIAQGYWCADPSMCPIPDRLKSTDDDGDDDEVS